MALIETSITLEERTVRMVKAQLQRLHVQVRREYQELHKTIWANPSGLTGQKVMDALGKDGGPLIDAMTNIVAVPNQFLPEGSKLTVTPEGTDVVKDLDGNVTVTTK